MTEGENDTVQWVNVSDVLSYCFPTDSLNLNGSTIEEWLFTIMFPILALFGVIGNSLNILVLRDKEMKRSYFLFFCLALSDILFFFTLIPAWLASYRPIAEIYTFRQIFFVIKIRFFGLANWVSAFNIWTVCLISLERYSAVHNPMKQKKMFGFAPKHVIVTFLVLTFLCTSYFHYDTVCKIKTICNGTQLFQACIDVRSDWNSFGGINNSPEWIRQLVGVLRYVHALVAISSPLILIIVFNISLIYHAKTVGFSFQGSVSKKQTKKLSDGKEVEESEKSIYRRHSETTNQQRTEHRITQIAISIIVVFIFTNLPSAIVLVHHTVHPLGQSSSSDTAQVVSGFLTMLGKAVNFFIFCTLSANFRKRLTGKIFCGSLASSSSIDDFRRRSKRFNL